jgi:bacteriocin biosynthesis cyclodehydratase domain-containing protein
MSVDPNAGAPVSPETLYLFSGEFGRAVVERLHPSAPGPMQDIGDGTHPSLWPHADLIVLATASDRPRIAEAVDRTAFLRGVPWLSIVGRATEIQVGPVVVPGRTPCHRCSEKRRRQHGLVPPTQVSAERSAGPQPTRPAEFVLLRHHVSLAVALADQALAQMQGLPVDHEVAATVRTFNVINGAVTAGAVVAVDNCDRCRGRFGPREETRQALWDRLEEALEVDPAVVGDHVGPLVGGAPTMVGAAR